MKPQKSLPFARPFTNLHREILLIKWGTKSMWIMHENEKGRWKRYLTALWGYFHVMWLHYILELRIFVPCFRLVAMDESENVMVRGMKIESAFDGSFMIQMWKFHQVVLTDMTSLRDTTEREGTPSETMSWKKQTQWTEEKSPNYSRRYCAILPSHPIIICLYLIIHYHS